ncbi:MAG TPA: hypothetical protein QF355_05810 [Candidatus Marinimicrobia bacterium]|uniref:Uncharacterized protein n=1 Tax=marine metagenome TaxID=408172 RepID=A0A381S6U4_9ZZZZ|nr:hypothetical protein [Candidatus Neomarinimicrobiota bacterium]MBQ34256.1 hypothetical protein [Candidatus Neomarinimicrobiota bacterium]MCS5640380.1 hypothetical protein [Candidatus Neomarinimicrobiota bacterium]MDP6143171.1 hypothetical protein [Candidatus Neomarinimicrobiota bacterium]MDP7128640.1 hypothetical protein [Candidatus Neomarinimicrobiota bacterium]
MESAIKTNIQITLSELDKQFVTRLAKRIQKSGFVTPAIFFLEMTKPLALLGSHAMVFFGPIVNSFIKADGYYRAAELFEEPDTVEFLLNEIERLDKEDSVTEGESIER